MNAGSVAVSLADLLLGSTILLGSGALVVALVRAPVHRQRAAELSVAATLVWLVLALIPLPRWDAGFELLKLLASDDASRSTSLVEGAVPTRNTVERPPVTSSTANEHEAASIAPFRDDESTAADAENRARDVDLRPDRGLGLALVYAIGSAAAAAYVLLGFALVHQILGRSVAPPPWLAALFDARCRALRVRRARLRLTTSSRRPLSAGIFTPTVLLPASIAIRGRESDLCCVIDHELVHVRRGDVSSRALCALAAVVLWPHPLFWWLRSRAALAAELIADDGAALTGGRRSYAQTLIALSEELQCLRPTPGIVPGTFRNRSDLTRRIEMLTSKHDRLSAACSPARRFVQSAATLAAIGACAALFGARALPAQESAVSAVVGDLPSPVAETAVDPTQSDEPVHAAPAGSSSASDARGDEAEPSLVLEDIAEETPSVDGSVQLLDDATPATRVRPAVQQEALDAASADALALVDRALTLRGELEMAQSDLAEFERLHKLGQLPDVELRRTQFQVRALQRRLDAVLVIVESEIKATEIELSQLQQAIELGTGFPGAQVQMVRLAGRLKLLQSAL